MGQKTHYYPLNAQKIYPLLLITLCHTYFLFPTSSPTPTFFENAHLMSEKHECVYVKHVCAHESACIFMQANGSGACICTNVCMCLLMRVSVYTWMYIRVSLHLFKRTYTCACLCIHMYVHASVYAGKRCF